MKGHLASTPTFPGAVKLFGVHPFLTTAVCGVALLAGVVAFGVYAQDSEEPSTRTVSEVSVPLPNTTWASLDSADRRGWTYYIVGSEEQASTLKAGLADADLIRHSIGEPALHQSVHIAVSPEDAAALTAAVADGNRTLVSLGLGEDHVVDLRGR
jgi:hypothetical protein